MTARVVQTILERDDDEVYRLLESVPEGVDLIEIRFDSLLHSGKNSDVQEWVERSPRPVIATVRSREQGGEFSGTEAERLGLLEACASSSALYVDVELGTPAPAGLDTSRIIRSYHDFQRVPNDFDERLRALHLEEGAISKIAVSPQNVNEALQVLDRIRDRVRDRVDTVTIPMGEFGLFARIGAGAFAMPLTYSASPLRKSAAPGQISSDVMTHDYRGGEITPHWSLVLCQLGPDSETLSDWNKRARLEFRPIVFLPTSSHQTSLNLNFMKSLIPPIVATVHEDDGRWRVMTVREPRLSKDCSEDEVYPWTLEALA